MSSNQAKIPKIERISVIEAATIIWMSRRWVSELVKTWVLKSIRPGKRKLLIYVDSLDEYLRTKGMDDIADNLEATILKIREEK